MRNDMRINYQPVILFFALAIAVTNCQPLSNREVKEKFEELHGKVIDYQRRHNVAIDVARFRVIKAECEADAASAKEMADFINERDFQTFISDTHDPARMDLDDYINLAKAFIAEASKPTTPRQNFMKSLLFTP